MAKQATVKAPAKSKRRRKIASLDQRKARVGWWFILPFLIGIVLVYLPIIFDSIRMSFCELEILTGQTTGNFELTFVGLDNYQKALFEDPSYYQTLIGGLKQLVLDIPAIVIFSLFMAVLLNQKMFGRAAFRAIFFIPVILATGLIGDIDMNNVYSQWQSNTSEGINTGEGSNMVSQVVSLADFSKLFQNMQVGKELLTYVVGIINNIFNIINRSGVQMLIFLAGLQSISPAIYESCSIDGASGWETFWKITIPMVSPMILVNTVYTIIDAFTANSNTVMNYIKQVYNQPDGTTVSSAMAWLYFLIVMVIIAAATGLISGFVFYQKRDA